MAELPNTDKYTRERIEAAKKLVADAGLRQSAKGGLIALLSDSERDTIADDYRADETPEIERTARLASSFGHRMVIGFEEAATAKPAPESELL